VGRGVRGAECDRRHSAVLLVTVAVAASVLVSASRVAARGFGDSAVDRVHLAAIEDSPSASTDSTIVEIPIPITLKAPEDGAVGYRLRLRMMFAWNDVRFIDVGGEDIATSLQTLTVVPGFELMIPVAERWMIRPYVEFGGLSSLDVSGHRWIASLGARAFMDRSFERWLLTVGGRFDVTTVLDEDWSQTDDVVYADVGADFSLPLWFDVMGERAAGGLYLIARGYLEPAELAGQEGLDLGVDSHLEVGLSFQIHDTPKIWFIKLPRWYGIGGRFAEDHRSFRVYLGFPF
jgi:hypothetical protein